MLYRKMLCLFTNDGFQTLIQGQAKHNLQAESGLPRYFVQPMVAPLFLPSSGAGAAQAVACAADVATPDKGAGSAWWLDSLPSSPRAGGSFLLLPPLDPAPCLGTLAHPPHTHHQGQDPHRQGVQPGGQDRDVGGQGVVFGSRTGERSQVVYGQ